MTTEKAKSPPEKGKDEKVLEPTEPTEPVVTPLEEKGKSEAEPENFEQKYKSLQGINEKLRQEVDGLKGQQANIDGVVQKVEGLTSLISQQGMTLGLLLDAVSEGAESSEDMRGKIKASREVAEGEAKRVAEANKTYTEIIAEAGRVDLNLMSEEMKPAKEAWEKGNAPEALKLTKIAVGTKISTIVEGKVVPKEPEKEVDKEKLNQPDLTHAAPKGDAGLTPMERIKQGYADLREKS